MSSAKIYARVSTSMQSNKAGITSLDVQEKICKKFALKNGFTIKDTYKITSSAYRKQPFKDIELNKKTHLIFNDVSRFSRNCVLGKKLIKELINDKNIVYFMTEELEIDNVDSKEYLVFEQKLKESEEESKG